MQGRSTTHHRQVADAVITITWNPRSKQWDLRATRHGTKAVQVATADTTLALDDSALRGMVQAVVSELEAQLVF